MKQAKRLDRLSASAWYFISESYYKRITDFIKEAERNPDLLNTTKNLPADYGAISVMAEMLTKSYLMGLDRSTRKMEFAEPTAEQIETLPYAEAVEYLKKRKIKSKLAYDELSAQMKFRAFTASRISDGTVLKRLKDINNEIIKNVESGDGLREFLKMTKTDVLSKVGLGSAGGWYWETVYRTNVQTAYNAGRMMGYEEDKPLALELVVIDDARTSEYCRQYAGKGFILPYDDPFWKTHIPPFHFNCRTTIRAIYDQDELPESWSSKTDLARPAKGFGKNPVMNDDWWKELDSQVRQAKMYGVQQEIARAEDILINGETIESVNTTTQEQEETLRFVSKMREMPFFTEDIKAEDRELVFNDLKKIQPKHAKLLEKYLGKMRGDFYSNSSTATYDPTTNRVNLNIKNRDIRSTVRGFTTDIKSFLHESGHWLDNNTLGNGKTIRSQLPELENLLEKDFINYCNRILPADNQIKKIEDLFDIVNLDNRLKVMEDLSKDSALKCGIQDIVSGLTKNGFRLRYVHINLYWSQHGIEQDSIAHFFEANGSGGLVEQYMFEIFPSAYEYFNNFIRGL